MDITSILNWAIQAVVMSFVSLLMFQFITGLFVEYNKAIAAEFASIYAEAAAPITTSAKPAQPIATEFVLTDDPWQEQSAQLPDPWFTTEIPPTPIQQPAVVLPFPSLKLLPPTVQVQPKARATKKSTAKTKSPSTNKTKPTNKAAIQTRSKSRKSA